MKAVDILSRLIGFPSIVGTSNAAIVDWIADHAQTAGAEVTILPGPEGDRSNLLISVGPRDVPGYVLSGHMDVVPASETGWTSDPFILRQEQNRLYGRGTSDMKGFLACALAALPQLVAAKLHRPIHLAFSYDEEAGCRGVPHLLAALPELCAKPLGAIIGEPSRMQAIRAHKGKAAARIEIGGRSGHSSRPDLGLNALHAMAATIADTLDYARQLTQGPFDGNFEPPYSSLQFGTIKGGQAVNIIADFCQAELEVRAISGQSPVQLLEPVRQHFLALAAQGFSVKWHELSAYPALSMAADAALVRLMADLTGQPVEAAVSYGTEAGLYQQAGMEAIICGPGDIARAHRPDEFIELSELYACLTLIGRLSASCSSH